MLDDFREWLSDNLRYILLGLAAILILVIAFFAVKLISGIGSPKEKEPQTEIQTDVLQTEGQDTAVKEDNNLEKNRPEILALVEKYYTARQNKDYETLAGMCENFDDAEKALIESQDAAVESYSNFMTYSKAGLTDDAYVVYIYVEIKLTGIDTQAPSLHEKYILKDVEGNLMIAETDYSQEVLSYTQEMHADADVQALIKDVDDALEAACQQDAALKQFVESQSAGNSGAASPDDTEGDTASETATGTMQATTGVNVRGAASTDGALYGTLYEGQQVEVLENLDSGWSKVRYTTNGTTIEGYVMTQYLGAVQ